MMDVFLVGSNYNQCFFLCKCNFITFIAACTLIIIYFTLAVKLSCIVHVMFPVVAL